MNLLLLVASLALAGCATFSDDAGFGAVETVAKERLNKDVKWARDSAEQDSIQTQVGELLKKPLTADDAVQIALLNNRGLQATFAELGIAEADRVRAGRLPNPGFSYARLRRGDEVEIERGVHFNLAALIALPFASRIEGRRFEQTQISVTSEMLALAAQTRKAYFRTVAAQETVNYMEQVATAAEAGAELANRMASVGNWSKLNQAREQAFYAEATAQLARAKQIAITERERLTRLMGLWGEDTKFQLPERLPDLPKTAQERQDIEQVALSQRLDVQMAKRETEGVANSLGLTKTTRFINVLEVGYLRNSATNKPTQTGYEISLELPLFDFGSARVAKAEAIYMQAVNRTAQIAIDARSEARAAYTGYRTAFDLAQHYRDEIVPLRKKISEENLLRYNGMLIGVFELLADAREQAASVNSYIEALRDFWLAESELEMALTGKSSGDLGTLSMKASTPAAAGGGH
ncbi:MAG TPA: TolC family protein [Burkholderiaceae bacterium]|nr:TolC family protein [Burkholderiaceae bacterium]